MEELPLTIRAEPTRVIQVSINKQWGNQVRSISQGASMFHRLFVLPLVGINNKSQFKDRCKLLIILWILRQQNLPCNLTVEVELLKDKWTRREHNLEYQILTGRLMDQVSKWMDWAQHSNQTFQDQLTLKIWAWHQAIPEVERWICRVYILRRMGSTPCLQCEVLEGKELVIPHLRKVLKNLIIKDLLLPKVNFWTIQIINQASLINKHHRIQTVISYASLVIEVLLIQRNMQRISAKHAIRKRRNSKAILLMIIICNKWILQWACRVQVEDSSNHIH